MTDDWELDGRKLPAQVLEYLRKMAVRAVKEQGYSDGGIGLESPLYVCLAEAVPDPGPKWSGELPGTGCGGAGGGSDAGLAERDGGTVDAAGAWL